MTGLLSDLEPRRGNRVEFQPGMLSSRHPSQKFIFACGSRVAHEKQFYYQDIGFVQCHELINQFCEKHSNF